MSEQEKKVIEIPEISRVEGHSAVTIDLVDGKVSEVKLDVFEGTRFFEKIVLGHKYSEVIHITSRVCAICSTGHVIAAANAVENAFGIKLSERALLLRELMHLGMIIESHATHICALALPDFVGAGTLYELASKHEAEFQIWTQLRALGAEVQTVVGGRPFHPVNIKVGGFSRFPDAAELNALLPKLEEGLPLAESLAHLLLTFKLPVEKTAPATFVALKPPGDIYGYFGTEVQSSDDWSAPISEYKKYLNEKVVSHSHAKRSMIKDKPIMVGSLARLRFYADRLKPRARAIYVNTEIAKGNFNTLLNNIAQSIEVVEAIERAKEVIQLIAQSNEHEHSAEVKIRSTEGVGAVECPRGTLYHCYSFDESGAVVAADMITPSAQNTARIEQDIAFVVDNIGQPEDAVLQARLETLVRAYDPCNTCATHMVTVNHKRTQG